LPALCSPATVRPSTAEPEDRARAHTPYHQGSGCRALTRRGMWLEEAGVTGETRPTDGCGVRASRVRRRRLAGPRNRDPQAADLKSLFLDKALAWPLPRSPNSRPAIRSGAGVIMGEEVPGMGEDGLGGIFDDKQHLCFALALWNGKDPIMKERLFVAGTGPRRQTPQESASVSYPRWGAARSQCHETGRGWVHIGDSGVRSLFHRG
jgi:hypothetical protein